MNDKIAKRRIRPSEATKQRRYQEAMGWLKYAQQLLIDSRVRLEQRLKEMNAGQGGAAGQINSGEHPSESSPRPILIEAPPGAE